MLRPGNLHVETAAADAAVFVASVTLRVTGSPVRLSMWLSGERRLHSCQPSLPSLSPRPPSSQAARRGGTAKTWSVSCLARPARQSTA